MEKKIIKKSREEEYEMDDELRFEKVESGDFGKKINKSRKYYSKFDDN
jgi:hypothetical protein